MNRPRRLLTLKTPGWHGRAAPLPFVDLDGCDGVPIPAYLWRVRRCPARRRRRISRHRKAARVRRPHLVALLILIVGTSGSGAPPKDHPLRKVASVAISVASSSFPDAGLVRRVRAAAGAFRRAATHRRDGLPVEVSNVIEFFRNAA